MAGNSERPDALSPLHPSAAGTFDEGAFHAVRSSLRDFDLSWNKSLRGLQVSARLLVSISREMVRQTGPPSSSNVPSTIASPTILEVIIVYLDHPFCGIDTLHSDWSYLRELSQVEREFETSSEGTTSVQANHRSMKRLSKRPGSTEIREVLSEVPCPLHPPFVTGQIRHSCVVGRGTGADPSERGPKSCRLSHPTISHFCKSALSTKESQTYVRPPFDPPNKLR